MEGDLHARFWPKSAKNQLNFILFSHFSFRSNIFFMKVSRALNPLIGRERARADRRV